jgi:uncharacterized protein (TIGR00645 family)
MIERWLEKILFSSRWLLAPIYLGLVVGLVALVVKDIQHIIHIVPNILNASESDLVLDILGLIDLSLTASLVIIVVFSGYENFVSRIVTTGHEDWPEWMSKIDFTGLKLKLLSSIVAISASMAALTTTALAPMLAAILATASLNALPVAALASSTLHT